MLQVRVGRLDGRWAGHPVTVHVACYKPVIDNHDMEKSYYAGAEIIKIHQVVQARNSRIAYLGTIRSYFATKEQLSGDREEEENRIQRNNHSNKRLLELLISCKNDLKLF